MVILIKNNGVSEVIPVSEVTPAKKQSYMESWRHKPGVGIWKVDGSLLTLMSETVLSLHM